MRKFFVNLLLIPLLILSGCSKDKSDVPPVKPTDLISETEAEFALGGTDLSLEFNGVVDLGDNTYKITYLPTPLGSDDPVIVKLKGKVLGVCSVFTNLESYGCILNLNAVFHLATSGEGKEER